MVFQHCEGYCGFLIYLRIAIYGFLRMPARCFAGSIEANNREFDEVQFKENMSLRRPNHEV